MTVTTTLQEAIDASKANIEMWRPIPGHPHYLASTLGRIQGPRKILKPQPIQSRCRSKYMQVSVNTTTGRVHKAVSRLVALAFYGPSELTVDHLNLDKTDNRLCNISYQTLATNIARYAKTGYPDAPRGNQNASARLTPSIVRAIRLAREAGFTYQRVGDMFGIRLTHARAICLRKQWAHVI